MILAEMDQPPHYATITLVVAAVACGPSAAGAKSDEGETGTGDTGSTAATDGGSAMADSSTGPAPVSHGPFGDGSRLRARALRAGGGAFAFHSFYDTELDAPCRFFAVGDDDLRCLPVDNIAPPGLRSAWLVHESAPVILDFADPGCTEPALVTSDCHPQLADRVAMRPPEPQCGAEPVSARPGHVGEALTAVYRRSWPDDECEPRELFFGETVHALLEDDIDGFVRAELVDADGVRRLVSEDGAHRTLFLHDDEGRPCEIIGAENDTCVPSRRCLLRRRAMARRPRLHRAGRDWGLNVPTDARDRAPRGGSPRGRRAPGRAVRYR